MINLTLGCLATMMTSLRCRVAMAILGYRLVMMAVSTTLRSRVLMMMTTATLLGCRVLAGGAYRVATSSGRLTTETRAGRDTVCAIAVAARSAPAFQNQWREVIIHP